MKILILKNALACGQRFVAGDTVEVSEKTADILVGAKLAKAVELSADGAGETAGAETQTDGEGEPTAGAETPADGAGETAADKPKRGRGRNRGGAQK